MYIHLYLILQIKYATIYKVNYQKTRKNLCLMNKTISIKNVAPIKVLTTCGQINFINLEEEAHLLYDEAKEASYKSIINLVYNNTLSSNIKSECIIRPCFPIRNAFFDIDKSRYIFDVLPRTSVVSIMHKGDYDDLDKVFLELTEYITANNLQTKLPLRVIHQEKIKKSFFKKYSKCYITEIQVPIEE